MTGPERHRPPRAEGPADSPRYKHGGVPAGYGDGGHGYRGAPRPPCPHPVPNHQRSRNGGGPRWGVARRGRPTAHAWCAAGPHLRRRPPRGCPSPAAAHPPRTPSSSSPPIVVVVARRRRRSPSSSLAVVVVVVVARRRRAAPAHRGPRHATPASSSPSSSSLSAVAAVAAARRRSPPPSSSSIVVVVVVVTVVVARRSPPAQQAPPTRASPFPAARGAPVKNESPSLTTTDSTIKCPEGRHDDITGCGSVPRQPSFPRVTPRATGNDDPPPRSRRPKTGDATIGVPVDG